MKFDMKMQLIINLNLSKIYVIPTPNNNAPLITGLDDIFDVIKFYVLNDDKPKYIPPKLNINDLISTSIALSLVNFL